MALNVVIARIKVFFLSIIGALRRAMCCFSRRRKSSDSDLQFVNVVKTEYSPSRTNESDRDWNSWDDTPRTVEEHIEQYRQKLGRPPTPKEPEPEPDLFGDMMPEIKPQPVYYLGPKTEQKTDFSRLEAKTDIPIALEPELEDWSDETAIDAGWDELDPEATKKLIREKRKELRHQRQAAAKQKDGIRYQNQLTNNNTIAERIYVQNNYS